VFEDVDDVHALPDGSVPAAKPANDAQRVLELREYCILDSGRDGRFDRLTKLTANLLYMPIVLVSLVDEAREWFKAAVGTEIEQIDRNHGFCAHALLSADHEAFTVVDALQDRRFATHPFVVDGPKLRFYSGAPLVTAKGLKLGMLCVHDFKPRPDFGADEARVLRQLADVVMDEIDFHRIEVERSLLIGELSHRVKNVFSVVSSVATLSGRGDPGSAPYVEAFKKRLVAMASAHDHLVHNSWKGASLAAVVSSVVAGFENSDETAIEVNLPETTVDAVLAQTLALVFHELLTNSVKYGALKVPGGRVSISGVAKTGDGGPRVVLSWRERGGPPAAVPTSQGFGHRMLIIAVQQRGGTVEFDWAAEGLSCQFELFDVGMPLN
jgi:two-component sensor histidine kinase